MMRIINIISLPPLQKIWINAAHRHYFYDPMAFMIQLITIKYRWMFCYIRTYAALWTLIILLFMFSQNFFFLSPSDFFHSLFHLYFISSNGNTRVMLYAISLLEEIDSRHQLMMLLLLMLDLMDTFGKKYLPEKTFLVISSH